MATLEDQGELWDLENLARATGLCDWMYAQFAPYVGGCVVEVGAGIGTFSSRLLADERLDRLLLIEPEHVCVERLRANWAGDRRVTVSDDTLPDAPALVALEGEVDFLLCQNVLEHIEEDVSAVAAMARSLKRGGRVALLVPAHPWLYGNLDRAYGHHRRYTRERLAHAIGAAGLDLEDLYSFNLLGVLGWAVNRNRSTPGIGADALRAYELLLRLWRPIEERRRPPWGLSLIAHARRP